MAKNNANVREEEEGRRGESSRRRPQSGGTRDRVGPNHVRLLWPLEI